MSIMQRRQYVCLIWRTTTINVDGLSEPFLYNWQQNEGEHFYSFGRLCFLVFFNEYVAYAQTPI